MRKQFLFVDQRGGDCYYQYAGNCNITQGGKGSLLMWQYARATIYDMLGLTRVMISGDGNDRVRQLHGSGLFVTSGSHSTVLDGSEWSAANAWEMVVYTWDFTGPAGSGIVTSYVNGALKQQLTNVWAPQGVMSRIYVGQPTAIGTATFPSYIGCLAIWDGIMTAAQVANLWDQGARYAVSSADGTGRLTFLADFNGQYDAAVAAGSRAFAYDGAADRHALIDDGLRELGRKSFSFGMPKHDLSEGDPIPLHAIGVLADKDNIPYIHLDHEADYAEVSVAAGDTRNTGYFCGVAAPDGPAAPAVEAWSPGYSLRTPTTLRQWVQVPLDGSAFKKWVHIGPVEYCNAGNGQDLYSGAFGSGQVGSVVADAGNTPMQFRTNVAALSGTYPDDYWTGALLIFTTGANAGRCLKVTHWSMATQTMTVDGAFASTPAVGDLFVVDNGARIQGVSDSDGTRQANENMEATLWETDGNGFIFTKLEWLWGDTRWLRYEGGRTLPMQGIAHYLLSHCTPGYGQIGGTYDTSYFSKVRVRRIDIDGPAEYQLVRRSASGGGPALADNFLVMHHDMPGNVGVFAGKRSVKTWRLNGLSYRKSQPTKITNWQQVVADLQAPGTWRQQAGTPLPVEYDETTQAATCITLGTDAAGVSRLGYVRGTWNEATGRITWTDETPPPGRQNPFAVMADLVPASVPDRPYYMAGVVQAPDGTWSLFLNAQQANFDHFVNLALHGAEDRWSFSADNYARENLTPSLNGGTDALSLYGRGSGSVCANRDTEFRFAVNPYAKDPARRYIGYGRGKTIYHEQTLYGSDLRPLVGVFGADPRSLRALPNGGTLSPLPGPQVHGAICAVLGQEDCIAVLSDTAAGFTSGVGMWVSEDGVHFQQFMWNGALPTNALIPQGVLPNEPNRLEASSVFRIGDKRVYYYYGGSFLNFAWIRWNGESNYELSADKESGWFETCALECPPEGWGTLTLNVTGGSGSVTVEVVDATTELPLAGFRASECDPIPDGVASVVTWEGADLSETTADTIRLRIALQRPTTDAATPAVYDWQIGTLAPAAAPTVQGLSVNGRVNPAGVIDERPKFTWQYADPEGSPQAMYRLIVASTKENLDANFGDLWDTGDVAGDTTSATYAGAELNSATTYFWKVKVRNAKGAWSETW
jgi:hypothetical protein